MSTTIQSELAELAQKFDFARGAMNNQVIDVPQILSFERANTRLKKAIYEFSKKPGDSGKAQAMSNAIDGYQTAIETLFMHAQYVMGQAKDAGIDLSKLNEQYKDIFK